MEEKLSSPPRHSALACRARLPDTLRGDPCGSEASPALHRHRGGPNFKNAPALTRASSSTTTRFIYTFASLSLLDLLNGLVPKPSRDDPSEKYRPARYMINGRISRFPIKFRFARQSGASRFPPVGLHNYEPTLLSRNDAGVSGPVLDIARVNSFEGDL